MPELDVQPDFPFMSLRKSAAGRRVREIIAEFASNLDKIRYLKPVGHQKVLSRMESLNFSPVVAYK